MKIIYSRYANIRLKAAVNTRKQRQRVTASVSSEPRCEHLSGEVGISDTAVERTMNV